MANKTNKALAGLKYGQTLTEDQAAAVAAEWEKALNKAGAAMRAAVAHFESIKPTAPRGEGRRKKGGRQMIARVILAAALVACAAVLAAFGGFLALNGETIGAAALASVSLGGVFAGGVFAGR